MMKMRWKPSLNLMLAPLCGRGPRSVIVRSSKASFSTARAVDGRAAAIPSLLSAQDAASLLRNNSIKFIDASWMLGKKGNLYNDFVNERIPGAQFFDIDKISDTSIDLPHMLPTEDTFTHAASSMGFNSSDHIVVYGRKDTFSAARVWWTFHVFGHSKVSILNGGLDAWKKIQAPIESGVPAPPAAGDIKGKYNANMVADWRQVLSVVESGAAQVLDARSAARFQAQAPEPRPGLPSGHIPGSLSVPFSKLMKEDLSEFRSLKEVRDAFVNSGMIMGSDVVLSCGSGVTAAILCFGLHLIGKDLSTIKIYDGSWSEWGAREDLPRMLGSDAQQKP